MPNWLNSYLGTGAPSNGKPITSSVIQEQSAQPTIQWNGVATNTPVGHSTLKNASYMEQLNNWFSNSGFDMGAQQTDARNSPVSGTGITLGNSGDKAATAIVKGTTKALEPAQATLGQIVEYIPEILKKAVFGVLGIIIIAVVLIRMTK
jgi:hypothetical protein